MNRNILNKTKFDVRSPAAEAPAAEQMPTQVDNSAGGIDTVTVQEHQTQNTDDVIDQLNADYKTAVKDLSKPENRALFKSVLKRRRQVDRIALGYSEMMACPARPSNAAKLSPAVTRMVELAPAITNKAKLVFEGIPVSKLKEDNDYLGFVRDVKEEGNLYIEAIETLESLTENSLDNRLRTVDDRGGALIMLDNDLNKPYALVREYRYGSAVQGVETRKTMAKVAADAAAGAEAKGLGEGGGATSGTPPGTPSGTGTPGSGTPSGTGTHQGTGSAAPPSTKLPPKAHKPGKGRT